MNKRRLTRLSRCKQEKVSSKTANAGMHGLFIHESIYEKSRTMHNLGLKDTLIYGTSQSLPPNDSQNSTASRSSKTRHLAPDI